MRKQWYRLDNAALIFPAIIRKNWNNVFRVAVTLKEPVDRHPEPGCGRPEIPVPDGLCPAESRFLLVLS